MLLLNFSHHLTLEQIAQVEALADQNIEKVLAIPVQFDNEQPFEPQLRELMSKLMVTSDELQSKPILVNLPSLNTIAALLLAELHGRIGHFPSILRLKPVKNADPPSFEATEILNLHSVRDAGRQTRNA